MKKLMFLTAVAIISFAADLGAATITVQNLNDSGAGSLRQALADASSGDTIVFTGLSGTINLSSELTIDKNITITGPGADLLTLDGGSATRIIHVNLTSWGTTIGTVRVNVSGLSFDHGSAAGDGGAIYCRTAGAGNNWSYISILTVSNCAFANCYSAGANGGGAIHNTRYSTITVDSCIFDTNSALKNAGALYTNGDTTISNCAFLNNSSPQSGGAIHKFEWGILTIINSTFNGNVSTYNDWNNAGGGGAMHLRKGTTNIDNCTISGNSATKNGGGIHFGIDATLFLNIRSTIIAANTANVSGDDLYVYSGTTTGLTMQYSLLGSNDGTPYAPADPDGNGNIIGSSLSPISAMLSPIADNGGPSETMVLQPASPAINSGSNPRSLTSDQRGTGFLRTFGAGVDMGAFELQKKNWDFNCDNKDDVLAEDSSTLYGYLYLMNGASPSQSDDVYRNTNPDWSVSGIADFNGDLKSDLIWESASTGKSLVYLMDGFTILSVGTVYNGNTGWKLDKLGDFNGDGKTDILWKHPLSGQGAIYLMNGTAILSFASILRKLDWQAKSTGDFNGDGKADILWEVAGKTGLLYLMNGTSISGQGDIYLRSADWVPEIFEDFNGDGKCDMLWQNSVAKSGYMYLMDGLSIESQGSVYTTPPASEGWSIIESGDFNADGKSDLLWQNSITGIGSIWLMNGLTTLSSGMPYTVKNTDWQVLRLLDFNGDGKADILWQNSSTLKALDYIMNGTSISQTGTIVGAGARTVVDPPLN